MSSFAIRAARFEDAPSILELWRLAGSFPTRTDDEESVRALIAHDRNAVLVAEDGAGLTGSLVAAFDGWRGTLFRLAVLPAQRRRGVGRALVGEGERRLRERGAARINLYAIRAETVAVDFWNAVGYETDNRCQRFVRNL
ncbi:MAG: GNAT family N-acetyltransferase [Gaiellaceae bacterium]